MNFFSFDRTLRVVLQVLLQNFAEIIHFRFETLYFTH